MALRAGYYGLKNSVKKKLEKLAADVSGMKIIKTIGVGLTLTNAGRLNLNTASADSLGGVKIGPGLNINDGVVSAVASGLIYDQTEPHKIGEWVEAGVSYDVMRKVIKINALPNNASTTYDHGITDIKDHLIWIAGGLYRQSANDSYSYQPSAPLANNDVSTGVSDSKITIRTSTNSSQYTINYLFIDYVKSNI